MNLHLLSVGFLLVFILNTFIAGGTRPTHFTYDLSINCGSSGTFAARNGREWHGDVKPKFSSFFRIKGSSTISSINHKSMSADPIPHKTARASRSQFSYSFQVNQGQKILRLHFNPVSYRGFKSLRDLFTVEAGSFILLSNFSASLTAHALGVKTFFKEFYINIEQNEQFDIIFSPASSQSRDTYAFINGIEIISLPASLSNFDGGDTGVPVVGQKSMVYVENSTALEIIHQLKIKQDFVSLSDGVGDMFGMWATVRKQEKNKINNITWKIPVDVGFRYMVRLHFSKLGLKMAETGGTSFKVLINEMIVNTSIIVEERDDYSSPSFRDYIVMMKGRQQEGKRELLICLQSNDKFMDSHGPLKGFEIFKLSNPDNSLASPNPLPPAPDSPYWTIQNPLSVLGRSDVIVTIAATILVVVNIFVHSFRQIWEASRVEEENMLSTNAQQHCRRFSLAEIELATRNFCNGLLIGKGGFGKVYKGLINNGQQTVAIKRLKSDSKQGAHEFLTEIETLSELRHVNLVSLIGYCNEHQEMILIYEYMPCGTLADHLYKLARHGNSCSSLTWKQRLNICIGASRGLDYLHTGHALIHRDVKASNILLDESFTAKVSDFGLAKRENRSKLQSHVSTNVKGTYGYFDPYYVSTRKLTRQSDTYAFGVVLMEALCGRPAMDRTLAEDEQILTKWARENIAKGKVDDIVAPSLRGEIKEDSLKVFLEIAERCLHDEPKKRPTMSQVVLRLEFALDQQESTRSSVPEDILRDVNVIRPPDNGNEQLTIGSTDVQTSASPVKEQTLSKTVKTEPLSGSKDGRKATTYKQSRFWPWDAFWNRVKQYKKNDFSIAEICGSEVNLPKFDWTTIVAATGNFSHRITQGGADFIYKAVLPTGKTVAVKRIPYSLTGQNDFKHEVLSLHKLQHQNIAMLLGYCIHRQGMLLVYEFPENGRLGTILNAHFCEFEWAVRFKIIMGIARGLLYLHQDSGLTIIQKHLTPNNISLDKRMDPKIEVITRTFEELSELITAETAATLGYMSPEYAEYGHYSVKSDVYSFGFIVLEILSNTRSHQRTPSQTLMFLLDYAWKPWNEKKALDLVDKSIRGEFPDGEALRCIQVGLLCTQYEPNDRPTMPSVLKMLEGEELLVEPNAPWPRLLSVDSTCDSDATFDYDDTLQR